MFGQLKFKILTVISILGLLMGCQFQDREQKVIKSPQAKQELLQGKFVHLSWMLSQEEFDFDAIVLQNEEIRRDIEMIHTEEGFDALVRAIRQGSKNWHGLVSPDGRLAIISWNTGLHRLGYDAKSMALFKEGEKIKVSSLYGNPKIFKGIQQIKGTKGMTTYILKENEEGSSKPNTYAYRISEGYLDPVP